MPAGVVALATLRLCRATSNVGGMARLCQESEAHQQAPAVLVDALSVRDVSAVRGGEMESCLIVTTHRFSRSQCLGRMFTERETTRLLIPSLQKFLSNDKKFIVLGLENKTHLTA